jgi:hypothetical protein
MGVKAWKWVVGTASQLPVVEISGERVRKGHTAKMQVVSQFCWQKWWVTIHLGNQGIGQRLGVVGVQITLSITRMGESGGGNRQGMANKDSIGLR